MNPKDSRTTPSNIALDMFVGKSVWTQRLRRRMLQLSNYSYNVAINGFEGTGKSLIAGLIHRLSRRQNEPFVPVDCALLPGELFHAQVLGRNRSGPRGLTTGMGCLNATDRGTLFLRNVHYLSSENQRLLVEALREKRRSGHQLRTICSSQRPLYENVKEGRFCMELFYLLSPTEIATIPLTKRPEDIGILIKHFLAKFTIENGLPWMSVTPEALAVLQSYHWPGNIRELEESIENALLTALGPELGIVDFTPSLYAPSQERPTSNTPAGNDLESVPDLPLVKNNWPTLNQLEASHIQSTLRNTDYNLAATALLLGIDSESLNNKIRLYDLRIEAST